MEIPASRLSQEKGTWLEGQTPFVPSKGTSKEVSVPAEVKIAGEIMTLKSWALGRIRVRRMF